MSWKLLDKLHTINHSLIHLPDTQHLSGLLMTTASESADKYNRQSPCQSSARKLIIIAFSHFPYDPVIILYSFWKLVCQWAVPVLSFVTLSQEDVGGIQSNSNATYWFEFFLGLIRTHFLIKVYVARVRWKTIESSYVLEISYCVNCLILLSPYFDAYLWND